MAVEEKEDSVDTVDSVDTMGAVDSTDSDSMDDTVSDYTKQTKPFVIRKSDVLWCIYFLIGIVGSLIGWMAPKGISIVVTNGVALRMILTFLGISSIKYIWIVSIVCLFFTFKRNNYPKYFSFVVGFYTLLLIFSLIGVVI